MGFTKEELAAFHGKGLPDLAGPGMQLLLVGINPGLWSAAAGAPFARPGNRFYPALHRAGIVDRATARADELTADELRAGVGVLEAKVAEWRPRVVAVLGITAYRTAFGEPEAALGRQGRELAGAELWALPNPSGLNAHHQIDSLAAWYAGAASASGIEVT